MTISLFDYWGGLGCPSLAGISNSYEGVRNLRNRHESGPQRTKSQWIHGMMMDTEAVVCDWAWWILDLPLPPAIAGDRRSGAQEQMVLGQPGGEPKPWRIV
ncbi:unnamed protein product [Caretta caretta]